MRAVWLLVVLVAVAAGAVVVWLRPPPGCAGPIAYRLDRVDERFGLSREDVQDALRAADALWRAAAGRDVFVPSPTAPLVVSLVYDERQQTTQTSGRLQRSLADTRASHAAVGQSLDETRADYQARARDYEAARAAHDERVRAYNAQVQRWNARGGVPPEAHERLEAERRALDASAAQLEADRRRLEELADTARSLADRGNAIAAAHNRVAETFNARYGAPRRFHKGEFDGRAIVVYEFEDARDLTLLLAHELGHALGLGHVDDPAAVMYAMAGGQVIEPLALAPADVAALAARCRRF